MSPARKFTTMQQTNLRLAKRPAKRPAKQQHQSRRHRMALTLSALAFLCSGLAIGRFAPPPARTVLIDRSYCPSGQWQTVADSYAQIYRQHQRKQLRISSVIFFSSLGQTPADSIPTPSTIAQLKTYGQPATQSQKFLIQQHSNAQLLSCRLES